MEHIIVDILNWFNLGLSFYLSLRGGEILHKYMELREKTKEIGALNLLVFIFSLFFTSSVLGVATYTVATSFFADQELRAELMTVRTTILNIGLALLYRYYDKLLLRR